MGPLVEIGLANALLAGALALVAVVAGRISRRPALVHALWLLVLIKLITPPIISLPLPWWRSATPAAAAEPPADEEPADEAAIALVSDPPAPLVAPAVSEAPPPSRIQDLIPDASGKLPAVMKPVPRAPAAPPGRAPSASPPTRPAAKPVVATTSAPAPARMDYGGVLELGAVIWIGGAAFWFAVALCRIVRFQRLLRHARSAPAELQEQARALARQMGLSRHPPVSVVPGSVPPLLWAVGRTPRLFFPQTLLPRLDEAGRSALLVHELAHLARRDHWVRWLELVVGAVYWWYPLAWLARRRLRAAEEECCDAWVVSELPGFGAVYAGALLETVDFLSNQPAALPPTASGIGRVQHLKRRLTMIVRGATPRGLSAAGKLLVVALLVALPLTPGRARPVAPPPPEAPPERLKHPQTEEAPEKQPPAPTAVFDDDLPDEPERFGNSPRLLQGNGGAFWANAISPDGKTLAAVSGGIAGRSDAEGSLTLFDLPSGKERACLVTPKPVRCVAYPHDGKLLATGDFDNKIQLRDPATGSVRRVLAGHTGAVNKLVFSRDGRTLFSGSLDKTVRGWDVASGKCVKTLTGSKDWVLCVALSRDGKRLLSTCRDNTATIWDVEKGKPLHSLVGHTNWVEYGLFSPDDSWVVTAGQDNLLKVWDARTGNHLRDMTGHTGPVNAAVFLPDGKALASCSHDRTIAIWDLATGIMRFTIDTGHAERIYGLDVSRDGKTLASASWDQAVKLWDVPTRKERRTLRPRRYLPEQSFPILSIACSPDGKTLAVCGEEKAVKLLDPATGRLLHLLEGHDDVVSRVAFSPDDRLLASASFDGTVALWDVATGKRLRVLTGHDNWVFTVAFSPDGTLLASGGYDRTVRLWQTRTGQQLAALKKHRGGVRAVAFSRDGRQLATGGADKVIRVWDVLNKEVAQSLSGHEEGVRALSFSADGKRLVSGSEDKTSRLWDVPRAKQLASYTHGDVVRDLTFSPRGQRLVAVDQARGVVFFEPATLRPNNLLNGGFSDAVTGVAFSPGARTVYLASLDRMVRAIDGTAVPRQAFVSHGGAGKPMWFAAHTPDGRRLALGGGDGAVEVRDVRLGRRLGQVDGLAEATFGIAVSPDGSRFAVACGDKEVRIYDLARRKLRQTLSGHTFRVWAVAWSPDGQSLASAAGSWENAEEVGEVKVWNLRTGKERFPLDGLTASTQAVAWSADGTFLATGSRDGTARIFEAAGGKQVHALKGGKGSVRSVVFAPDSRYLATGDDEAVRVYAVADARELARLKIPTGAVNGLDWSRDGQMLAATGRPNTAMQPGDIRLWQVSRPEGPVPTFKEKATLKGHADTVLACAFSPDGRRLLTGGGRYNSRGEVALWDTATGALLFRMHGANQWAEGVAFAKDGTTVVTSGGATGRPGEVILWNATGQGGWRIPGAHKGEATSAAWSRDGKRLATGGQDGLIKMWEAATGKLEATLEGHKGQVRCLAFSADGASLASASDDQSVKVWDLVGNREVAELTRHPMPALSVAFSPDGKRVASASGHTRSDNPGGEVRVIEVATGKEHRGAWGGKGALSVAFSPDGKHLTVGGVGGRGIQLYDVPTGKLVRAIAGAASVRLLAYSADGKRLASAHGPGGRHGDGSVQVWDTATWDEKAALVGHAGPVHGLSLSPDGGQAATASNDRTVMVWDLPGRKAATAAARAPAAVPAVNE